MREPVEIPPRYVRLASRKAQERNKSFEERGWNEQRTDPENDNFAGVVGELAFAIYADLQIDAETYEVTDDGIDFSVRIDGTKRDIDIKTRQTGPFALWVKESRIKADYFILGHLLTPEDRESLEGWKVDFLGMATKDELLEARRVESDLGFHNRSIFIEDLHSVPDADQIEPI